MEINNDAGFDNIMKIKDYAFMSELPTGKMSGLLYPYQVTNVLKVTFMSDVAAMSCEKNSPKTIVLLSFKKAERIWCFTENH